MDGPAVLLLALVTSAATAAGTVYVVERYNMVSRASPVTEAPVPDMRGQAENDARLSAAGARVSVFVAAREPNAEAKPGTVVRQAVPPGHQAPIDFPVSVVLAEDRLPNVINSPLPEAVARLEASGYSVQVGTPAPDPKVPEGVILRQLPKADVPYAKPGIVIIQASAGPGDVELPKLTGMGITAAKTKLEELGLKAVVRWVAMAETPTNVVLNQNPAAEKKVKPGSEVTLTACMP
jgi:eukaryotic-like serine/threonine-protein kinase